MESRPSFPREWAGEEAQIYLPSYPWPEGVILSQKKRRLTPAPKTGCPQPDGCGYQGKGFGAFALHLIASILKVAYENHTAWRASE
jgi:hypothetical protein